ncbi:TetR/AcrR family transcriptional regulator [Planobispora longispora]|uniref:Putative transcriptional regulator, TetR family protein n=1 Tax=Planobispora longispora TaxID=28887 RepID=A0A8J3W7T7_9ACTN|nr:TetR family transcriptional regulator [Planobispora longispora]GIH78963.1 putative transcriptional regulator, TetR family protein [Planobispora longispora]
MGKLTREAVVERALQIGDAEGLAAVTIRRLAQELGVTPMALYWHFKNKEQLTVGMADHLIEGFVIEEDGAPWQEQLRALVAGLVRVLRRHPCAAAVLEEIDGLEVPNFLRVWDTALGLAKRAGFGYEQSCLISKYLLHGAIALASGPLNRRCPGLTEEEAAERVRVKRLTLQSLPSGLYPHIVEMASPLAEGIDPDLYDTFGADLLIGGIEAMAATASARSARSPDPS